MQGIRLSNLREASMRRYRGIILPLFLLCLLLSSVCRGIAAPAPQLRMIDTESVLLQFKIDRQTSYSQIQFQIDGPIAVQKAGFQSTNELTIQLAKTRTQLPSPARVETGAVKEIEFQPVGSDLQIIVRLERKVEYSISQDAGTLTLQLANTPLERLISLNLDNQPLGRVLVMLSRQYGANIVAGSDVQGTISVNLTNVPLSLALEQILESEGYRYEEGAGGVLHVVPDDREQKLRDALHKAETQTKYHIFHPKHVAPSEISGLLKDIVSESGGMVASDRTNTLIVSVTGDQWGILEPLIQSLDQEVEAEEPTPVSDEQTQQTPTQVTTRTEPKVEVEPSAPVLKADIIRLSYADPTEVSSLLTPLLSPQGSILVLGQMGMGKQSTGSGGGGSDSSRLGASVAEGGTLVLRDIPEIIAQLQELAAEMDVPVEQVEIQAYIVEGTLTKADNVGIDWRAVDGDNVLSSSLPFGGQFPALQLRVGSLSANDFAGVLEMISSRTDTRILSNPKITSVSGRPAVFQSGDQIPYTEVVVSQNVESVATGFKDTGIILEVAASVKRNDVVSLTLLAEVSDVSGFTPTGQPRITGRTASTQVLVPDGDTVVLGGLVSNRTNETVSRVPLLGDIPLLGQLFRTKNMSEEKSEVTVFITPKIVRAQ